jgi:uncharacterized membrane protein YkvA (DUF1232 family)
MPSVHPDDPRIPKDGPRDEDRKAAEDILGNEEATRNFADETEVRANFFRKKLGTVWDDLCAMIRLVKAYASKHYREVPHRSILMVVAALVYFVSPIDLIPDWLPLAGILDDAAVLAWTAKAVHGDLEAFKAWERLRKAGKK